MDPSSYSLWTYPSPSPSPAPTTFETLPAYTDEAIDRAPSYRTYQRHTRESNPRTRILHTRAPSQRTRLLSQTSDDLVLNGVPAVVTSLSDDSLSATLSDVDTPDTSVSPDVGELSTTTLITGVDRPSADHATNSSISLAIPPHVENPSSASFHTLSTVIVATVSPQNSTSSITTSATDSVDTSVSTFYSSVTDSAHTYGVQTNSGRARLQLRVRSRAKGADHLPVFVGGDKIQGSVELDAEKPTSIRSVAITVSHLSQACSPSMLPLTLLHHSCLLLREIRIRKISKLNFSIYLRSSGRSHRESRRPTWTQATRWNSFA